MNPIAIPEKISFPSLSLCFDKPRNFPCVSINRERTRNAMTPRQNAISADDRGMFRTKTPIVPKVTMAVMICKRATTRALSLCVDIGLRIYGIRETGKSLYIPCILYSVSSCSIAFAPYSY